MGSKLFSFLEVRAQDRGIAQLSAEVSITAKPFFESRGFTVSEKQVVIQRGVEMINYKMHRLMEKPNQ